MDAFVGNPPFMGGSQFRLTWRNVLATGLRNFMQAPMVMPTVRPLLPADQHPPWATTTVGLLATNTIAQGDTRSTGLQRLVGDGLVIYDAVKSRNGRGGECLVRARSPCQGRCRDVDRQQAPRGRVGAGCQSRLLAGPNDPIRSRLQAMGLSFLGSKIYGQGFSFADDDADATPIAEMERSSGRQEERRADLPYLGGEEVNSSPTQSPHRYVINFGDLPLDEASRWADLLGIVRDRVKPERDPKNRKVYRDYWWQFAEKRPGLCAALAGRKRCLVTAGLASTRCFLSSRERVFSEIRSSLPRRL